MMRITFSCLSCGAQLETRAEAVGAQVECPGCKAMIAVPRTQFGSGTTIGGFRITAFLGKGGMAEVWLATQLSLEREVALKVLPAHLGMQEDAVRRFLQEVRLLARLSHRNIVPAYEAGEDGGILFFAMAYVRGESLESRLRGVGVISEAEALGIVEKVARALAYAWNQHQLIHRDIKPSNILMDESGEPMLVDLGLAKSLVSSSNLTQSSSVMGTPNYMSPEQAEGLANVGYPADMYSLGLTLYHMLTGQVPFQGSTPMETLRKQLTHQLPDPREFQRAVSEPCVELLRTMLAKKPGRRHKSWEDLIADIQRVRNADSPSLRLANPSESMLLGLGGAGRTPRVVDRAVPRLGRRAVGLKGVVLGVVMLAVLGGVAWWFQQPKIRGNAKPSRVPTAGVLAPQASAPVPRSPEGAAKARSLPRDVTGLSLQDEKEVRKRLGEALAALGAAQRIETPASYELRSDGIVLNLKNNPFLRDLGPLAGLPLVDLRLGSTAVTNLQPLAGMPLKSLDLSNTPIADLSPLQGIKTLESLILANCPSVADLSPLKNSQELRGLALPNCGSVGDLAPLRGLKNLKYLDVSHNKGVHDLSPLVGMNLGFLNVSLSGVTDLSPLVRGISQEVNISFLQKMDLKTLAGAKLNCLMIGGPIPSIKPLRDVSLEGLVLCEDWKAIRGLEELPQLLPNLKVIAFRNRGPHPLSSCPEFVFRLPKLEWVYWDSPKLHPKDRVPFNEFRRRCREAGVASAAENAAPHGDASDGSSPPLVMEDLEAEAAASTEMVATAPPRGATSPNAIRAALDKLQAGQRLDTPPKFTINRDGLVFLYLGDNPNLGDLNALVGLPIRELYLDRTAVRDLRPLAGMPLRDLRLGFGLVEDIGPVAGMKLLEELSFFGCKALKDISPLRGLPKLRSLSLKGCISIRDFSPLEGLKLASLNLSETTVGDIAMLRGMPLKNLQLERTCVRDLSVLGCMELHTLSVYEMPKVDLGTLAGAKVKSLVLGGRGASIRAIKGVFAEEVTLVGNCTDIQGLAELPTVLPMLRGIVFKNSDKLPLSSFPEAVFRLPSLEWVAWNAASSTPLVQERVPLAEFRTKWTRKEAP